MTADACTCILNLEARPVIRILLCACLMLVSSAAFADYNLNPVNSKYTKIVEECEVPTMPKARVQGGLPICYAASAAVMLDEYTCFKNNNTNCEALPDSERVSMIDISRLSEYIVDGDDRRDRWKYHGLKQGGSIFVVLLNAYYTGTYVPMSCLKDTAIDLLGWSPKTKRDAILQGQMWDEFKAFHARLNGRELSMNEAAALKVQYTLQQDTAVIQAAMKETTWPLVLEKLLVPQSCSDDWENQISPPAKMDKPKLFPEDLENDMPRRTNYKEAIAKGRSLICESHRPFGLNFCAVTKGSKSSIECAAKGYGHGVVVHGYRRVCDASGKKCIDSVRVMNSWGDGWQAENQDGWVDAKTLFDATFYDGFFMTWLESRPKGEF